MGRNKGEYICPKCGKAGPEPEDKPTSYDIHGKPRDLYRYVIHSGDGKRTACYVEGLLRKQEQEEFRKEISISDEELKRLLRFTDDTISIIAERYKLTLGQLTQLSLAEKQEYFNIRDRYISSKTDKSNEDKIERRRYKIERKEFDKLRKSSGIKTPEEKLNISTIKPPKEYWGESNTRSMFLKFSNEFDVVSKYLSKPPWKDPTAREGQMEVSKLFKDLSKQMKKLAKLMFYFKPSPEADDKNILSYNEWYEKSIEPIYLLLKHLGLQLDNHSKPVNSDNEKFEQTEARIKLKYQFQLISDILIGFTTETRYVVNERYLLPFSGWLKVLVDRYKNYTIGGTSKRNLLRTGEYVSKLTTNQDEIDKAKKEGKQVPEFHYIVQSIPVATSLTTKQIKNMTQLNGPVVRDLLNVLRGKRAQMELGIIKEDENVYDLIDAITSLSRASS